MPSSTINTGLREGFYWRQAYIEVYKGEVPLQEAETPAMISTYFLLAFFAAISQL